jgi:putative glutamine amidotransferase
MMNQAKPIIGIPCRTVHDPSSPLSFSGIPFSYTRAVEEAGGAPILIPLNLSEETLLSIFERLDGLLLAGGLDVHPKEFGEEVQPYCGEIETPRDEVELRMTRWALADEKPIFGICRGIQMLNVAAGGTLYQDIPSQLETNLPHPYRKGDPYNQRAHSVDIDSDSRVARLLGTTQLEVNSLHHQSLKKVAPGLKVIARAPDGVIEAVESDDDRFIVGVQFHPELLWDEDARMHRLFEEFVASARKYHEQREPEHAPA